MRVRFKIYIIYVTIAAAVTGWSLTRVHGAPDRPPAAAGAEAFDIWDEITRGGETDTIDALSAVIAAFRIAQAGRDPAWAARTIDLFDRALARDPANPPAQAHRGAALALIARDYPLQGAWLLMAAPGFTQLAYVLRAVRQLDAAVAAAPEDPVVRLVRAVTLAGLPGILSYRDAALDDFALIEHWAAESGPRADAIRVRDFQASSAPAYADVLDRAGRSEAAARLRLAAGHPRAF